MTTATRVMQTSGDDDSKPTEVSTSTDVRRHPPTSATRLIDRLKIAMLRVGVNNADLARALGIKPQNLTNMQSKTKVGGSDGMRVIHVARAASFLHCDLHWLCTGDGGDYVPAGGIGELSEFARDIGHWIDTLSPEKRAQFVMIAWNITRDRWPVFPDDQAPSAR